MFISKRVPITIIIIIIGFTMASCKPSSRTSYLLDNTCEVPCWHGIKPGETSAEDATKILGTIKQIDRSTITRENAPQFLFSDTINWHFIEGYKVGAISINENTVMEINFYNIEYPVHELIKVYGEPDFIYIQPYTGLTRYINIFFLKKGIWLTYTKAEVNEEKIMIESTDAVNNVEFFYPSIGSKLLDNYFPTILLSDKLITWMGFGEYEIKK